MDWRSEYEKALTAQEPPPENDWRTEYEAARPVGLLEGVQQVSSSIGRGAVDTLATGVQGVGLGLELLGAEGAGKSVQAFGKRVSEISRATMPLVERLGGSFLLSKAPAAFGSGASFALGGTLLKAVGVPAWASTMSMGAAVQGAAQYEEARMAGMSEEDLWKAYLAGGVLGTSEAIPIASILNRADKASGGALKKVLVDMLLEGGEEALQEGGSQMASNLIASHLLKYDKDRELWKDVLDNAAGGAFAGVMLSALASASAHGAALKDASGKPQEPGAPGTATESGKGLSVEPTHAPAAGRTVADIGPETAPGATEAATGGITPELRAKIDDALGRRLEPEALAEAQKGLEELQAKSKPHVQGAVRESKKIEGEDPEAAADRKAAEDEAAAREAASVEEFGHRGQRTPAQSARLLALGDEILVPAAAELGADSEELAAAREVVSKATSPRDAAIDVVAAWRAGVPVADLAKTPTRAAAPRQKPKPVAAEEPKGSETVTPVPTVPDAAAAGTTTTAQVSIPEQSSAQARPAIVPQATPEGTLSIKNSAMAAQLEEMGLPPVERGEVVPRLERFERAQELMARRPEAGAELVTKLEKTGRAHTADEGALLVLEVNRLANARDAAQDAFNADPTEDNKALVKKAFDDFMRVSEVAMTSGTEAGSALNIRAMLAKRDYSLASMERSFAEAGHGKLSDDERAWIVTMSTKLAKQRALADEGWARAAASKKDAAQKSPRAERREQRATEIAERRRDLARILDELGARFGTRLGAGPGGISKQDLTDIAKVAAHVIMIGEKTFAQWASEMVERFGDHVRQHLRRAWNRGKSIGRLGGALPTKLKNALTKEELAGTNRKTRAELADAFASMPVSVEDVKAMALVGEVKRGWYKRAAKALEAVFGDDARMFIGMLAATSPLQKVRENLRMTFTVYEEWVKRGRPTGDDADFSWVKPIVHMGGRAKNAIEVMQVGALIRQFKVGAFDENLRDIPEKVTLDTWMAKAFQVSQKLWGKKSGYLAGTALTRIAAKDLGWTPAEVQETVWSAFMALTDKMKGGVPAAEAIASLTDADVARVPEFAEQMANDTVVRSIAERLGLDMEAAVAASEARSRGDATLASDGVNKKALQRLAAYAENERPRQEFSFAAAVGFGRGAPRNVTHAGFMSLPFEAQARITGEITQLAAKLAASLTGLKIKETTFGPGGWQTDPAEPAAVFGVSGARNDVLDMAQVMGYLLEQTEVYIESLSDEGSHYLVDILAPELADPDVMRQFWADMVAADPEIATGYHPIPGGMRTARGEVGDGSRTDPELVTINTRLLKAIDSAAKKNGVHYVAETDRGFVSKVRNDWTTDQAGDGYLSRLAGRFGPRTSDLLRGHRRAVDSALADLIAEHEGALVGEPGGLLRVSGGARANASLGPGSSSGLRDRSAGREALHGALNGSGPAVPLAPGESLVALAGHRERAIPRNHDPRGKRLVDASDLGGIILDSPLIERFQFALARDGVVVNYAIWAAGTPDACFVPFADTRAAIAKMFPDMRPTDVLWALHNHPAGTVTPSAADAAVANRLDRESGAANLRHALIANGTVVEYSARGFLEAHAVSKPQKRGVVHESMVGRFGPHVMAAILKRFAPPPAGAVVVFTDAANLVRAAWSVPERFWQEGSHEELAVELRERAIHYGAVYAFAHEGRESWIPWPHGELKDRLRAGDPGTAFQIGDMVHRAPGIASHKGLQKVAPKKAALVREPRVQLKAAKRQLANVIDKIGASTTAGANVDPTLFLQLARASFAVGYRQFDVWVSDMVAKIGEHVRPYLREAWDKAKAERAQASRLKARKAFLRRRAAELRNRMATGDFAAKPKPEALELDAEAIRLEADYEETRREFEVAKEKKRLANRTKAERRIDAAKEVFNLPKALKTAWDVSAVFRQGIVFSIIHPIDTLTRDIPRMFSALLSERAALDLDVAFRSHFGNKEMAAFAERSKLELTRHGDDLGKHEEAIRSALSDRFPGIKASNRAYITFLNSQRVAAFDAMVAAMPSTPTAAEGKTIARFVNIATGRGDPGKLAGAVSAASLVLWSPRLLISRFQLITLNPLWGGTRNTRIAIAKQYGRFLMGIAAGYGLIALAQLMWDDDDEDRPTVELDPRSSDFGKVRIGNVRVDPLGGLAQVTVASSRALSSLFGADGFKSSSTGETRPLRFGDMADFLRSKLSPTVGIPLGLTLRDSDYEPITKLDLPGSLEEYVPEPLRAPLALAGEFSVPLSFGDIGKAIEARGVPQGTALSILSLFGAGLQVREPKPKKRKPFKFKTNP